jgi:CBS domain-containing protein
MAEFLRIDSLLARKPSPIHVRPDDSLRDAIQLMKQYEYSQLPVVDDSGRSAGLVTCESVARKLLEIGSKDLLAFPVKSCCIEPRYVKRDDDLFKHLDLMADDAAVLVGSPNSVEGIITNYDILKLFRRVGEPFLMLRDIEVSLRSLVERQFPSEQERDQVISDLLKSIDDTSNWRAGVQSLTVEQLRLLVLSNWERFRDIFRDERANVGKMLQDIRDIRNKICHFRGPLSSDELDQLKQRRDWILRYARP